MKKNKNKLPGPIRRLCAARGSSVCGSADLHDLDWGNWFQDNGYIHVYRNGDDTWHRVYPKKIKGRICKRVSVVEGYVHWLHDEP